MITIDAQIYTAICAIIILLLGALAHYYGKYRETKRICENLTHYIEQMEKEKDKKVYIFRE